MNTGEMSAYVVPSTVGHCWQGSECAMCGHLLSGSMPFRLVSIRGSVSVANVVPNMHDVVVGTQEFTANNE